MDNDSQIESLEQLLRRGPAAIPEAIATARAEDVAEVLNRLPPSDAATLVDAMPFTFAVKVLEHPEFDRRDDVLQCLTPESAIRFIEAMPPDQQADVFRDLPHDTRESLLRRLDPPTRASVETLLRYPPTMAGGLMTTDYVSVSAAWTAGETLEYIRQSGRALSASLRRVRRSSRIIRTDSRGVAPRARRCGTRCVRVPHWRATKDRQCHAGDGS